MLAVRDLPCTALAHHTHTRTRRYLLLEFPVLALERPLLRVAEIGAGAGASILPVLRANPSCTVVLTDISATCLLQLREAAQACGLHASRIESTFVADASDPGQLPSFADIAADLLLMIFTLSVRIIYK